MDIVESRESQPVDRPTTPEEVAAIERHWLENVYRGDSLPELTLQVIVVSIGLGFLMIAFNIYMGLKTGWGEGGSLIAVILGFAIVRGMGRKYSELENNMTQTFASAAGSLGNIVNVIPALFLLAADGLITRAPTFLDVLLWVFFTSFLGVFFAIPLRRQVLVIDQLVFPTGTASAQTIKAMHAHGAEALQKARALGIMGLWSALVTWLVNGPGAFIPGAVSLPFIKKTFYDVPVSSTTIGAAVSPMMIGAGFLIGPRVATSMAVSGLLGWGFMMPWLVDQGILEQIATNMAKPQFMTQCTEIMAMATPSEANLDFLKTNCKDLFGYRNQSYYSLGVKWLMWPGLGLMVAAGLTSTLMKWKILLSAVTSLFRRTGGESPIKHLKFPTWAWALGLLLSSAAVVGMLWFRFGVHPLLGLLSVPMSFVLAVIAVRATGETDINPVGAMGSVTQIAFGTIQQASAAGGAAAAGQIITGNLLTGGVAASGASEAADMMQDLKTGYLLGATPKKQVYAQLMGVTIGSLFCAPIFWVLIQAHPIGSEFWPAPAAITWSGLATMMAKGASAIPTYATYGLAFGTALGVILTLMADKIKSPYMPSAVGLGVALVVPYIYTATIFMGAMMYLVIKRRNPAWIVAYAAAIGAGGIAGEGLTGVLAAAVGLLTGGGH